MNSFLIAAAGFAAFIITAIVWSCLCMARKADDAMPKPPEQDDHNETLH